MWVISEKAMAPHSSTLAWKIPWTEEPGGLQSMGLRRVGYDWATSLSLFTFMHWRRKWQPTPVFLPGESQGRGSLVGCRPLGRTESDTTEATLQQQQQQLWVISSVRLGSLFQEPHGCLPAAVALLSYPPIPVCLSACFICHLNSKFLANQKVLLARFSLTRAIRVAWYG